MVPEGGERKSKYRFMKIKPETREMEKGLR
jgi:hypothetical protein